MPRYKVIGGVRVSAYTLVEADNEKEAIAIARSREGALAPHGWAQDGVDPTETFVVGGADGEMFDCKIEPMDKDDRNAWRDRDEGDEEDAPDDDLDDLVDENDESDDEED